MQCPRCGSRGLVNGTINHGSVILRYRRCPICDHRWKAWEEIDKTPVRAKKSGSAPKPDSFANVSQKASK